MVHKATRKVKHRHQVDFIPEGDFTSQDSESHHVGLFSAGASLSYSDHVEDFSSDSETMFEDGFIFIPNSDFSDPSKWEDTSGDYMVHKATRKVKHKHQLDFIPESDFSDPSKWADSSGSYMMHKATMEIAHKQELGFLEFDHLSGEFCLSASLPDCGEEQHSCLWEFITYQSDILRQV